MVRQRAAKLRSAERVLAEREADLARYLRDGTQPTRARFAGMLTHALALVSPPKLA